MLRLPLSVRSLPALLGLLVLSSCHVVERNPAPSYVPQGAYVPALPGAGAEGSASIGTTGLAGQVAIAPAPRIFLTAQGQRYRGDKRRDDFRTGEVGLGLMPWRGASLSGGLFAGVGAGRGSSRGYRYERWSGFFAPLRFDSTDWRVSSAYRTFYLMPALVLREVDERVEAAFAAKLVWLTYRQLNFSEWTRRGTSSAGVVDMDEQYGITAADRNVRRLRVQLSSQVAFGITPQLWVFLLSGLELERGGPSRRYNYSPLLLNVGLRYRLSLSRPTAPR